MSANLTAPAQPPVSELLTARADTRGERLYPSRSNRLYWMLTCLRREMEHVVESFIAGQDHEQLIDFGCGNMPYRSLIEPHIGRYIGCDLAGNEQASHTIENGRLPFDDESADIVLSNQVLEHVRYPQDYLREARRVLRTDGLLVLSTHGVWRYHPDPGDYWRWTSSGLRCELEEAGFELQLFRGMLGPEATALQLWQDAVRQRCPRRLRRVLYRYIQWRMERADRVCPPPSLECDASVYIVVATKPRETA